MEELRDGIQAWRISRARLTEKQKATVIKTACLSNAPPALIKVADRINAKGIKPIKFKTATGVCSGKFSPPDYQFNLSEPSEKNHVLHILGNYILI